MRMLGYPATFNPAYFEMAYLQGHDGDTRFCIQCGGFDGRINAPNGTPDFPRYYALLALWRSIQSNGAEGHVTLQQQRDSKTLWLPPDGMMRVCILEIKGDQSTILFSSQNPAREYLDIVAYATSLDYHGVEEWGVLEWKKFFQQEVAKRNCAACR